MANKKDKLGTAQATTATAHKIARVIYHLLRTKTPTLKPCFISAMNRLANALNSD